MLYNEMGSQKGIEEQKTEQKFHTLHSNVTR